MTRSIWRYVLPGVLAIVVAPLAVWLAGSAQAQSGPPPLFTAAAAPPGTPPESSPLVLRRRAVTVNSAALGGQGVSSATTLTINLFDDTVVTATRTGVDVAPAGNGYVWRGRLSGATLGTVTLVVTGGTLAGDVTVGLTKYQVRPLSGALHWVKQINAGGFPNEGEAPAPPDPGAPAPVQGESVADNGRIIDVAVFYSDNSLTAAGLAGINAEIAASIADTNAAYVNSGITQRVRLVYSGALGYTESGNQITMLNQLQNPSDGVLDGVHAIRNQYGADIVALIVEEGSFCGIAYDILSPVSHAFENKAFTVVNRGCSSGNHSFAHELGHLMGARHDWYVDPTNNSPFTYNHGYTEPGNTWRTVMAYVNDCGSCPRLQYFSNPDVLYGGVAMGRAEGQFQAADNRKALNNTAVTVSRWRDCKVNCAAPEVAFAGSAAPNPVGMGAPFTYSFTGSTSGLYTRDLVARLTLPAAARATTATVTINLVTVPCVVSAGGTQVSCSIGVLASGGSFTVNVPVRAMASTGTNLCASGVLSGSGDAGAFYKTASACTRVLGLSPVPQQ